MVQIALLCTSAADLNGHPTGLWIEECATPYYMFTEQGYDVVICSPAGGPITIDPGSMAGDFFTAASKRFMLDPSAFDKLQRSQKLESLDMSTFDGIYLAGGHGTCVDFVDHAAVTQAIETVYAANKVVAADCHGPVALCGCTKPDGTSLVAGKKVTGFTDSEEAAVQLTEQVPFLLETKLMALGGKYEKADDWHSKVVVDGKLVTGQNPQSSEACAAAVIALFA